MEGKGGREAGWRLGGGWKGVEGREVEGGAEHTNGIWVCSYDNIMSNTYYVQLWKTGVTVFILFGHPAAVAVRPAAAAHCLQLT